MRSTAALVVPEALARVAAGWSGSMRVMTPERAATVATMGPAALAMAEQRIVLETIVRRSDLTYADPEPEREIHRNVTLVPKLGGRVVVKRKLD